MPVTIQSWSGGKDSTASIILEHQLGLPPSDVVMVEVMYDIARNISGELPEHIDFVRNVAVPTLKQWGHKVTIVRADTDYISHFYHTIQRSVNHPERIGKYVGFPIAGRCSINRDCKMPPIRKYLANYPADTIQYVGIAVDEPQRLARLDGLTHISLLAQHGYTEQMCFDLCRKYGLLSPAYDYDTRNGCWFCPNNTIVSFADIKMRHPDLWTELEQLSHTPNMVSPVFRHNKTFAEINQLVDELVIR